MEDKYNKILENVIILADEEVIEICTKKSFYDTCLPRIPQDILSRENLCKLLSRQRKKCPHFGLNTKEKRLHKKIRHYTMKIVNFNAILLHDKPKNEYYIVFYRSGLSFNANIANFYFTGVTNTSALLSKRRKLTNKKLIAKMLRRRAIKKPQNVSSFKNYVRHAIKEHYSKYLDGKHSVVSVHAIFTVDNATKSKVFITRDITNYSDIGKFIKMIDEFDPTLKWNVVKKMEDCLGKLNIPMNNVLVIAQLNQSRKNLFIQWNDKLVQSLHRKNIKNPTAQLVNTNILNLRLDHIRFNGVESENAKCFMNIIEELVAKKIQGENIQKKLEKQLNSCKTFIACLDAFETNQMSDVTKLSPPTRFQAITASSRTEPISEIREEVGDVGDSETETSVTIDEKFEGILSKIDTLQKRIRTHVKTSPSLGKDADVPPFNPRPKSGESRKENFLLKAELTPQLDIVKRDPFQKSKFCKPEVLRKDSTVLHSNLLKIEEYLKRDFQKNKLRIEGILQNDIPDIPEEIVKKQETETQKTSPLNVEEPQKQPDVPVPPEPPAIPKLEATPKPSEKLTLKQISSFEKLLRTQLEHPDPEFEKLFRILQKNASSDGFKKLMQHLKNTYQDKQAAAKKPPTEAETNTSISTTSKQSSTESNSLKSLFTGRNVKLRPRSRQKRQKRIDSKIAIAISKVAAAAGSKPSEPTVIKLENFIDQILKITKTYFTNGSREDPKKVLENVVVPVTATQSAKTSEAACQSGIITIKKYTEMEESRSEMSTNTVNSFVRRAKMTESAVQTDRNKKRRLIAKLTQTEVDVAKKKAAVAMETQTDISIHKHAQIKFSGMSMQLSKNVTITNVRKNVINVRNICEETSEAVKRLLEREAVFNEDCPNLKNSISGDLRKGKHKAEILGQIKNTLENVIDRFKKSTLLISKASNFADMSQNLKKVMVPPELPVVQKSVILNESDTDNSASLSDSSTSTIKEDRTSNLTMSLKLLKNLSEVTKTIRKNPREAARKLYGIRNELMHYRKNNLYNATTSKVSSRLYLPKTSSTLTSKPSRNRLRRADSLFPKNVPLNMYGYPASNSDLKADLNELNRIFTPKTRSICNTELSILKHRDRHADHIASHLSTKRSRSNSKYCFDLKTFRTKSAQIKSHKCQMYIAKTYKRSYANSLSQTACAPTNVPQIQTAIENPLVPKIVRPVRWKHPLPESPQLSNLSLKDVKPFNSEYPRKDHVAASTHTYLDRLLDSPDDNNNKPVPTIKCCDNDCVKCSEKTAPLLEVSVCGGKSPNETTDFIVNKGKAHFKTETPKSAQSQVTPAAAAASVKFDFGKFMLDPDAAKNLNVPKVQYTVYPVNILQSKTAAAATPVAPAESPPKSGSPPISKRLHEVKNNQNKIQKSIQQAIVHNQEKFQAMQRILALSKPQERKMSNPPSSKNIANPPKIKSTHTKKFSKNTNDASTSKSRTFSSTQKQTLSPQQSHSIQTAVATYKTVKQVQPHPKLKQLQQHQIPLKPKLNTNPPTTKKPTTIDPNTSANFNKKYSEVSLSSLRTITKEEKQPPPPKTLTQNLKNVKRSQEDIQKYIALVEQKFLKTFSLNEQEKEGAYKNLVDEIQGMLNVLNSKDKVDKKTKIKKSLEKLSKETENMTIEGSQQQQQQKPETPTKKAPKPESPPSPGEIVKYAKTLESVEKSLKDFQNNCAENSKLCEAATEKLLSWKTTTTTTTTKSTHEDISKTSVSSRASQQYTLSEKERIIEEKCGVVDFPSTTETNEQTPSVVVIKNPVSMATMDQQTSESNAVVMMMMAAKKKTSDFSQPTLHSTTINSNDSLTETDENITCTSFSMNSSFRSKRPKQQQNLRSNKSRSGQKIRDIINDNKILESSPNSTDTSLIPISNEITENSYLTITEFSATGSSSSGDDIKITPLVEFSAEMYLCGHLHYSYRCQPPVAAIIPHVHHQIIYTEKKEPKPITQAYKQKYNECYDQISNDCPISSSLNFSNLVSEDSFAIEQEFMKNYSDKLFTESINSILSKNSDFTLKNIFSGNSSSERLVRKTSSNFYEYIDLLSNISRIFIEPEVTQFYQPKFVSHTLVPERETKTYHLIIVFCRVHFNYATYNPSHCNLLNNSESNLSNCSATPQLSTQYSSRRNTGDVLTESFECSCSVPLVQNSSSYVSVTQNTVSEFSDLTMTQFSNTSVSTADLFSEAAPPQTELTPDSAEQFSLYSDPYYSVKSSITKIEYLNDNVEIQTVTRQSDENISQLENVNILIQNVETSHLLGRSEDKQRIKEEAEQPSIIETSGVSKKLSLEELYVENASKASKKSSTCFNIDNLDNSLSVGISTNDDDKSNETEDDIVENIHGKDDFKRLSNKLAQQSNELGQILMTNQYHRQGRLPKLVSVKNFSARRFMSNPFVNRFDDSSSYDCNYDLKLTISPKYLGGTFPSSRTCMQILPMMKNRVGSVSHSLTMKIELNQLKVSRSSSRNISFKKPKRNVSVFHKNMQNLENMQHLQNMQNLQDMQNLQNMQDMQNMQNMQDMQKSESLSSSKFSLIQIQNKEMNTESYKMILIFLYVSLFSLIFTCMTLNYKCE